MKTDYTSFMNILLGRAVNEKILKLLALPEVSKVKSHMCAFGMKDEDNNGEGFVKKPTGFMINASKIA